MKKFIVYILVLCVGLFAMPNGVSAAYTYDPGAALLYASDHWDDGVGLCAEFVWNCVYAGGIKMSKQIGTRQCFSGILNNSYANRYQLVLNANGRAMKANNAAVLSPGDVVVQYCTDCGLYPHIMLFSKYASDGEALFYAHNGAMNNEKFQLNANGQHQSTCNIIAYVAHFPQSGEHYHVYTESYEAVHPHRYFKVCDCGYYYYTGENAITIGYEAIHPHREYNVCAVASCEYNLTYTGTNACNIGFEEIHPHREYNVCALTSCAYHMQYTGTNATKTAYSDTYPYNEYYICPITSCSYHNAPTGNSKVPEKPVLKNMAESYMEGDSITFTWDEVANVSYYSMFFFKLTNGEYTFYEPMEVVEPGVKHSLECGKYGVLLQAAYGEDGSMSTGGDMVYFSVNKKNTEYTVSSVSMENKQANVYSELYNISKECKAVVAGYLGDTLIKVKIVPVDETTSFFNCTLDGEFDEIKLMLLDSTGKLKPLCETEIVLKSE